MKESDQGAHCLHVLGDGVPGGAVVKGGQDALRSHIGETRFADALPQGFLGAGKHVASCRLLSMRTSATSTNWESYPFADFVID